MVMLKFVINVTTLIIIHCSNYFLTAVEDVELEEQIEKREVEGKTKPLFLSHNNEAK